MKHFEHQIEGLQQPKMTHIPNLKGMELTSVNSIYSEVTTSPTDCFTSFLTYAAIL
jgi:hypothetical protein